MADEKKQGKNPVQNNPIDVSYNDKKNNYWVSGDDIFKYNKPQFVVVNMFESNIDQAKEKGWSKFVVNEPKLDFIKDMDIQQRQQFLKNKLISAVMDEKREASLNKVYKATVYQDNVDYNDPQVVSITNKYLLAKLLKDENVNFTKLGDWSQNTITKAVEFNNKLENAISTGKVTENQDGTYSGFYENKPDKTATFKDLDAVTKRASNYFERMDDFVTTLQDIGIMKPYKEDVVVLDSSKPFVREQLIELIKDKESMVNEKTLKAAHDTGVANGVQYKQNKSNSNMDKIKQAYNGKGNQQTQTSEQKIELDQNQTSQETTQHNQPKKTTFRRKN